MIFAIAYEQSYKHQSCQYQPYFPVLSMSKIHWFVLSAVSEDLDLDPV